MAGAASSGNGTAPSGGGARSRASEGKSVCDVRADQRRRVPLLRGLVSLSDPKTAHGVIPDQGPDSQGARIDWLREHRAWRGAGACSDRDQAPRGGCRLMKGVAGRYGWRRAVKAAFLHACRVSGVVHIFRLFAKRKLLVLCYHGFELDDESRFRQIFTPRDSFRHQLEVLSAQKSNVVSLGEGLARLKEGRLTGNTTVITIDDGFYGAYAVAAPLLEKFGYTATIYVSTYHVIKETPVFRLVIYYVFDFASVPVLRVRNVAWGEDQDVDLADRDASRRAMWQCITYGETACNEAQRQEIARRMSAYAGIDYEHISRTRMFSYMNRGEIRDLASRGFDIQLHTHRHRFPPGDRAAACKEIEENRGILEACTGYRPVHFCYPDGIWDRSQWAWLKEMGVESAVTSDPGLNDRRTPLLALRRFSYSPRMPDVEFAAGAAGLMPFLRPIAQPSRRGTRPLQTEERHNGNEQK
ncbi:MAG: polysaccharide deacetylase family protein [Chitinivibrionales bacterium]|nr:polysaccharide deacetylase family protein [Chitinivibrionales bacterium]MBD3395914.1 polysaccharide deacetylase family protein [Chitinivibrionales bacterium]